MNPSSRRLRRAQIAEVARGENVALPPGPNEEAPPHVRPEDSRWRGRRGGADARNRTADPFITSEVLCQLSYVGSSPRF